MQKVPFWQSGEGRIKDSMVWAVESQGTWRQGGSLPYLEVPVVSCKEGAKNSLSWRSPLELYLQGQGHTLQEAPIAPPSPPPTPGFLFQLYINPLLANHSELMTFLKSCFLMWGAFLCDHGSEVLKKEDAGHISVNG